MRFLFGFLLGLIAGLLALASAIVGFVAGVIAAEGLTEKEESDIDESSAEDLVADIDKLSEMS